MIDIDNYLKQIFHNDNIKIKCISRLKHKNLVYYVKTESLEYAVKIYYQGIDKSRRYTIEKLLYEYFTCHKIIALPNNIFLDSEYQILITKWIDGISLKNKLKKDGLQNSLPDIELILSKFHSIWNINDYNLINKLEVNEIGLSKRNNLEEEKLFDIIINNYPNINFNELIKKYYELKNNLDLNALYVINSDVSAHEFIKNNNTYYFLDFERFCLGNPNNDLARLFFSLAETIDEQNIYELYSLFKNDEFYENNAFIYFLIEKLFGNLFVAPLDLNNEQINIFINFIFDLLEKKDKTNL